MRVAAIMATKVRTIGPDAPVAEAVASMADGHVSSLPVVDHLHRLIGVVSTTDILAAEAEASDEPAREVLLHHTAVGEIMTPRPLVIAPEADLREAARQMLYGDVHRLFVVLDEALIGVISTTDIVRAVAVGHVRVLPTPQPVVPQGEACCRLP